MCIIHITIKFLSFYMYPYNDFMHVYVQCTFSCQVKSYLNSNVTQCKLLWSINNAYNISSYKQILQEQFEHGRKLPKRGSKIIDPEIKAIFFWARLMGSNLDDLGIAVALKGEVSKYALNLISGLSLEFWHATDFCHASDQKQLGCISFSLCLKAHSNMSISRSGEK